MNKDSFGLYFEHPIQTSGGGLCQYNEEGQGRESNEKQERDVAEIEGGGLLTNQGGTSDETFQW